MFVPHRQLRTPRDWPAWPHKRWVQTLVPKNKLGLAVSGTAFALPHRAAGRLRRG